MSRRGFSPTPSITPPKTRGSTGRAFAFKGLFGLYHGKFSIAPYYLKVKVYGDIENRDIWEYRLNLTEKEIDRLLRHVWEMRFAWFDYYFFDENCSYHLLSLLEVARPGLHLTDRFSLWVIPSETIRAMDEAGLVKKVRFRPARDTLLRKRASLAGRHPADAGQASDARRAWELDSEEMRTARPRGTGPGHRARSRLCGLPEKCPVWREPPTERRHGGGPVGGPQPSRGA